MPAALWNSTHILESNIQGWKLLCEHLAKRVGSVELQGPCGIVVAYP